MIPTNLKLSNFTSYGQTPVELDFTKFKLAAISGLNGAGKSSLLDAITWCIWGTSRAGDSSDSLIHSGGEDMQVEFSFQLDNYIYTIKRRRNKKGGGSTALELWSGSTSSLHNLTEGTIKSTQEKIINILHLNFETFSNSSYLRQGHADEFTTKGPTDRKRILSDILGLAHYDKLEEKAKEKIKEIEIKLNHLSYSLLEIEAELSQKEEREKSLNLAEEEAKKVEDQLKQVESLIKLMGEEKEVISSTIKTLEEKKNQNITVKKELSDIQLQIEVKEKSKQEFQEVLLQKIDIEKNYLELEHLQNERKALEVKRSELIKIKDQLVDVQKVLVEREEKRSQAITGLEIDNKKYQTENEQLEKQNKHLTEHKTTCPTCKQTIDDKKNNQIVSENKKRIDQNLLQIKILKEKIAKYKNIVLPEQNRAEILQQQVKEFTDQTKNWTEVIQKIAELEKYSTLYMKLQQAETAVKTHTEVILDLEKIYQSKISQLSESEKELEKLVGFENKLQEIKEGLVAKESIKHQLSQKALQLRGAVGQAKQLVSQAEQLEKIQKEKQVEKDALQKSKEIYEELSLAFGKKGIQAMIIEAAIPEIEDEANSLLNRLTEGRMKISLITQKETKTKVLGERGIVETLDIIISDEMGERAYEMYSGGEAFRVNFAIRLAISKLLTHRAGAKLQFLVIDEGFGSQDAPGRSRLVEVIDTIKDDFEKILIITHIEELKEEFPVRIEVSKNGAGSTFEVVGA